MSIILYLTSLLLGSTGAFILKSFAFKWGFIDHPQNRSSHCRPTPKGGGMGILAAFVSTALILKISFLFLLPTSLLALLSLFGDRFDLSPKIRLPMQFIAALIVVQFLNLSLNPTIISTVLLTIFIVGSANCYNFMDGINGIAAIAGIVCFSFISLFIGIHGGDNSISVLSICISCACFGFLPFNIPKARVFMGDAGSILLGFVFSATIVILSKNLLDFVCLASFLFPFYSDELITMAIRIGNGENLMKAHRRHLYQLLANEMAIDHWKVSVAYGFLQLLVGICVLLIRPFGFISVIVVLVIYFFGFASVNYVIRKKCQFDYAA